MSNDMEARFRAAHARLATACVTGTNGKTTTTSMLAAIVRAAGQVDAMVTTLGARVGDDTVEGSDPQDVLLRAVELAVLRGARTLCLETTSLALARGFASRWPPTVAVFTNLTRDHLDYHPSPEAYLASKAQLFCALPPGGVAVLNADDPASALIAEVVPPHARIVRFAIDRDADLRAIDVVVSRSGTTFGMRSSDPALDGLNAAIRGHGAPHVANALAAILGARALGYSVDQALSGLREFAPVPGRFEPITQMPLVVVDYAHSPDGLERTLATARQLVGAGELVCVFGCGGERDREKRPQMGRAAHLLADRVILTSDNPRREDPQAIADHILAGVSGPGASWTVELDRRAAIRIAIEGAAPQDVVVVAGKGHETVQEIGAQRLPFCDADVVRELANARR